MIKIYRSTFSDYDLERRPHIIYKSLAFGVDSSIFLDKRRRLKLVFGSRNIKFGYTSPIVSSTFSEEIFSNITKLVKTHIPNSINGQLHLIKLRGCEERTVPYVYFSHINSNFNQCLNNHLNKLKAIGYLG